MTSEERSAALRRQVQLELALTKMARRLAEASYERVYAAHDKQRSDTPENRAQHQLWVRRGQLRSRAMERLAAYAMTEWHRLQVALDHDQASKPWNRVAVLERAVARC